MIQWWETLDQTMKIFYAIATFSSAVLVIQTVIMLMGFGQGGEAPDFSDTSRLDMGGDMDLDGGAGFDADFDGGAASGINDGSIPGDFGDLRLFSFQSIVAFLTVFSWMSIAFIGSGSPELLAILIGLFFGVAAMFGVAKLIQASRSLASEGNIVLKNALGQQGRVYIPIKADGLTQGKVLLTLQERLIEQDAITEGGEDLPSGASVRVVDIKGNLLVVEREEKN